MKTTLEKILEEFDKQFPYIVAYQRGIPQPDCYTSCQEDIKSFISQKFPEYAKEIVEEERNKIAKEVMDDIGHNDDCIFCGLKDKKLKELKV